MTTTTSRLLNLLSLLQTRRDWPGSVLAERLSISHRTVRRDVDRLREMGYSIHATMGPDGGYRLDAGSELPPLLFDDDQVLALSVALRSAAVSGVGIAEAAMRALSTVRQVMPSRLRRRLDAMNFTALPGWAGDGVSPEVLTALSAAARATEVLRFDYAGSRPVTATELRPPRRVEPHHLVTWNGRWYLVAWDLEHDDWRIFRADRMNPRVPTGPRFTPRPLPGSGHVADYVAGRFKGSHNGDRWPCTGKVVLGRPASYVRAFAGDGMIEDLGDGRCTLETGAWSWVGLAASLNRFDTDIDVIGPPELLQAFGLLAVRNGITAAGPPVSAIQG